MEIRTVDPRTRKYYNDLYLSARNSLRPRYANNDRVPRPNERRDRQSVAVMDISISALIAQTSGEAY